MGLGLGARLRQTRELSEAKTANEPNDYRVFGCTNGERRKRWALTNLGTFINAHLTPCLILLVLLGAVGHAQQPANTNPSSSSGTSISAQAKDRAASDRVVLRVGNTNVTEEEFESRIEGIEPHGGDPDKDGAPEKDRRRLGDDYASVLMLSQQAIANGLDSSPEVIRKLAIARMQILSDAEFASLMRQAEPSSEEIRQYYSAHLSDYDEVQIRRLFIWKQGDKSSKDGPVLSSQAARVRADQIRRELASGISEKTLAENLIKSGNGMLDPEPLIFPRGQLPPAIEKVAFALKPGEWSEVEDTPSRLLVIQLVKRDRQALGQVSSHIEKDLQGQKMQALLDGLKAKAGIWMDEQFFGTAVPDPQSEPQKSAKKGEK